MHSARTAFLNKRLPLGNPLKGLPALNLRHFNKQLKGVKRLNMETVRKKWKNQKFETGFYEYWILLRP
jgi:hypothetical protein